MTCPHPIVVDEQISAEADEDCFPAGRSPEDWWRLCAFCATRYNRTAHVLAPLRAHCDQAWGLNFTKFKLDDEDALEIAG